jgi:hypothetical protein
MTEKMKNFWAGVVVAGCIFGLVWMAGGVLDEKLDDRLPPCPTEDSDNCYWDGSVHGNGEGRSFTVVNGIVDFWD